MLNRRNFNLALSSSALALSTQGMAQSSKRPISIVVAYPPGGSSDIIARILAVELGAKLGETVIVENRAGGNGTIGAAYVAGMPPDGRTMLYTLGNLMLNQEFLLQGVKFRAIDSLTPVGKTCDLRVAIVSSASHPAKDLREFISMASANPGKHSFAFYGDLGVVSMAIEAGIELLRVPYKGGPPGLVDVAAGNVDIIASSLTQAMPLVQSGKLKVLGVMTAKRWTEYPSAPTVLEILPKYKAIDYQGFFLPSNAPKVVVDTLWTAVSGILANPEVSKRLVERGAILDLQGPEEFKRFFHADRDNIKRIVEMAKIQPE